MKRRKYVAIYICFIICILNLCGCIKTNKTKSANESVNNLHQKWFFYDETCGEIKILRLEEDGAFSYNYSSKEEIEDFDMYDTYEYNKKKIILHGKEVEDKEIDVLRMNEYHLMLEINGEIKDFIIEEEEFKSNFYANEGKKHFSGYNSRCSIIDITGNKVTYGPINYDKEGLFKEGPFENLELAKNPKFYEVTVKSYNSIQGDSEYEEFYEVEKNKISKNDIEKYVEDASSYAYVWLDESLKIEKIVFFGLTSILADYIKVTVPKEYEEDVTKEYLQSEIEEGIYEAAHINEDGSVLYLMLKEQYDTILEDKRLIYLDSLDEMCGEDNYNIKEIKANNTFTKFEVTMYKDKQKLPEVVKENLEYMGHVYNIYSGEDVKKIEIVVK